MHNSLLFLQGAQPAADWGQIVVQFFDANPGVFVALITATVGLLGVVPFILRVEFNRRDRESQARISRLNDEIEEGKDTRKLLASLTEAIRDQNALYREDRKEARESFLKALDEHNIKFSNSIGQIAGNQASSVNALQKTSDAITEVKNQLVQMQMDALNRDQMHVETRKALEANNRISETGFKTVGEAIFELNRSVTELKEKWDASHAIDGEVRDALKEIKMIVERLPVQVHDEGTTS